MKPTTKQKNIRPCLNLIIIIILSVISLSGRTQSLVSYTTLYDNSTFSRSIDLSKPVGATAGAAGTSPTGAATYTIPIACPPGTNGMGPKLAIVYNSQSGNSLLGQGWNLSGLSVITRAGWDEYHHAKTMPVTMTSTDALVLDGTYLYPKTGTYGTVGATYHTEAESYAVITSISTGGSDQYFNVVQKDGTLLQYGNSADSRMMSDDGTKVMMWRLNMIQDINGNYIWFTYTNTDRDSRISQIKYTGNWNTGMLPYNEMNFVYNIRSDQNKVYEAGYSLQSKYLLTQIEVKGEGEVFRLYQFDYGKKDEISYLRNVSEFNSGGESLNDTRFKYGESTVEETVTTHSGLVATYPTASDKVASGDFDGDGLSDLMILHAAVDPFTRNIYNSDVTIKKRSATTGSYSTSGYLAFSGTGNFIENSLLTKNNYVVAPADFNGDGREDIVISNSIFTGTTSTDPGIRSLESIKIYYANSSGGIGSSPDYTYTPASSYNIIYRGTQQQQNYFYLGDFDGDGSTDFITILSEKLFFNSPRKGVYNKESTFFNLVGGTVVSSVAVPLLFHEADGVYVVNMDGDAKSDLMLVQDGVTRIFTLNFDASLYDLHIDQISGNMEYPTTWHDILFGDFNGDGKTDILTGPSRALENDKREWSIGYSTGKGFQETVFTFDHIIKYEYENSGLYDITDRLCIGDFDGDGRTDIYDFYYNGGTPEHQVYYSTGTQFAAVKKISTSISSAGGIVAADFNGDGKVDIMSNKSVQFVSFNSDSKSHLLDKVTDGFNRMTSFNYKSLPNGTGSGSGAFYTKGSGEIYPVNNIQPGFYVATEISAPDGIGGTNTLSYQYENLRLHRAGRGLLGFEKIKTIDVTGNIRSETIFDLDRTYYIPWLKTSNTFLVSPATHLSQQDNNTSVLMNLASATTLRSGGAYPYVMLSESSTAQDLQKGVTTVTSNTYDGYIISGGYSGAGNITQSTTSASGGPEAFTTTVQTSYVATGPSPVPSRPSEVTMTTQRGTKAAIASRSTFSYYTNGLLKDEVTTPVGTPGLYQKDRFEYDAYGNITLTEKSTPAIIIPHLFAYDSKGRFVISEENELGHTKHMTAHKFWGRPLSVTGYNGLTTTYTYDTWGKLAAVNIPTGIWTAYTITYSDAWDISGNQLYYTLSQDPSAPDTKTWYDVLNRPVRTRKEAFGGAWTTELATYDARGNVANSTQPYLSGETPITTSNTYDEQNRLKTVTDAFGGTTTYNYSAGSGTATVSVTLPDGKVKSTKTDAIGKVLESSNGLGGTVLFEYDSRGNDTRSALRIFGSTTHELIAKEYDVLGRLKTLKDHDAGTFRYTHDILGRLEQQTDPKGKITSYQYDIAGRMTAKFLDSYTSEYEYYDPTKDYRLKKQKVSNSTDGTVEDQYDYAIGGGMISWERNTNGTIMTKQYGYDLYNRPETVDYPVTPPGGGGLTALPVGSAFRKRNHYDANGFLTKITTNFYGGGSGDKVLYQNVSMNGLVQPTQYKRVDNLLATTTYNKGVPTHYETTGGQDLLMDYNYANGNLTLRQDMRSGGLKEEFAYDAADRLVLADNTLMIPGGAVHLSPMTMSYATSAGDWKNGLGRIVNKSDIGDYKYAGFPANAVRSVPDPAGLISHATQNITYKPFDKADKITEPIGGIPYEEYFVYDAAEDRAYTRQQQSGATVRQRWYMDGYEMQETPAGTQFIHYIEGDAGLCGMVVADASGAFNYYAVYTDHLGSITRVNDEYAAPVAELAYDAWGKETSGATPPDWLYRGYTGHEMLPEYGLINMNGRMYDPINARMLRPDNFVQSPLNAQSYNRYSYCFNNPLKYTDPSGDIALVDDAILGVIGGVINLATNWKHVDNFKTGASFFGIGFVSGALSEYISPVGSAALAGAGNAALIGYNQTGTVEFKNVATAAATSAAVSVFTMGIGNAVGSTLGSTFSGISSPVLRNSLTQGALGAGLGAGTAFVMGGDVTEGALWGFGTGLATGAYSGYRSARTDNVNPWTGRSNEPLVEKPTTTVVWDDEGNSSFQTIEDGSQFGNNVQSTSTRVGRDGYAVEILFKNGNRMDINAARVKEWTPNLHPNAPPGTLQKVKFDNFLPGSKGFKRAPTPSEINFLNSLFK